MVGRVSRARKAIKPVVGSIPQQPRVYLAGPEVFCPDARAVGERKKSICRAHGFQGVFALDAQLDLTDLSRSDAGFQISQANEALIRSCHLLIANLTPFRGPSADVGTAYELGYMRGLGRPVFAYSNDPRLLTERTLAAGSGTTRAFDR